MTVLRSVRVAAVQAAPVVLDVVLLPRFAAEPPAAQAVSDAERSRSGSR
jgi:hypothetical protein